jgi:fructose-1,6-bisphosphatase/inositol monophosphatase family enzyme
MALNALERACLEAHQSGAPISPAQDLAAPEDWARFCIRVALQAGNLAREMRLGSMREAVQFKPDGSPATLREVQVEELLRERLAAFAPDATVVGEETGGTLSEAGVTVAIDPIDGTWSFLSRTETHATTLAVLRDRQPQVGLVLNPATGEFGYSLPGGGTRLVALSVFGEPDAACSLPADRLREDSVLVNLHPGRGAGDASAALYGAWARGEVNMVRSPGGSPACGLLEAAKGSFVYANLWSQRPAAAYDLAAGVLLVREAGGDVVDLAGDPIDAVCHKGPFVAGVAPEARARVVDLLRAANP